MDKNTTGIYTVYARHYGHMCSCVPVPYTRKVVDPVHVGPGPEPNPRGRSRICQKDPDWHNQKTNRASKNRTGNLTRSSVTLHYCTNKENNFKGTSRSSRTRDTADLTEILTITSKRLNFEKEPSTADENGGGGGGRNTPQAAQCASLSTPSRPQWAFNLACWSPLWSAEP
jgi:hypothetical protein